MKFNELFWFELLSKCPICHRSLDWHGFNLDRRYFCGNCGWRKDA